MEIIPAIDIIGGKCVRLTQGDFQQSTTYHDDPLTVARQFEDAGLKRLHLVDLDGARTGKVVNLDVLAKITARTTLNVDFGGGVQSTEDLARVFASGARQVTGGSIAVRSPQVFEEWLAQYGNERIILGADVKDSHIAIAGWQQTSHLEVIPFLRKYQDKGIKYVICTDVSKDGLLKGPSHSLYQQILKEFPALRLIASGGVSTVKDLEDLQACGVYGVIIGKAIYEGNIRLSDFKRFL